MRIVDRAIFLALPKGTVFHTFRPYVLGPLTVKMSEPGHFENDWYEWEPGDPENMGWDRVDVFDWLERDREISVPLGSSICRDGMYEDDALFLVYRRSDVMELVKTLLFANWEHDES